MIDFKSLTMGEIAFIEDMSGRSITSLEDTTQPLGKALAAIACVVKRRTGEPKFTWNQALALTMDQANEIIGISADEDEAEEEGKGVRSKTSETN